MGTLGPKIAVLRDGARVTLRSARPDEAAATLEFRARSARSAPYIATSPHEVPSDPLVQRARIEQFIAHEREVLLVAFDDAERIIALAALTSPGRARLNHVVDLGMALDEAWRGRGLGTLVMQALLDWARACPGVLKVSLGVIPENHAAVRLYQRMGFVADGVQRAHFRRDDGVYLDHALMACWVNPGAGPV